MEIDEIEVLSEGFFDIDLDEAWRKVPRRQFGGTPGRSMAELIQNAIDSYPPKTALEDRLVEISTGEKQISVVDHGEGMDWVRLKFLVTLGGTDKRNDSTKIGAFGIGFFSIFGLLDTLKVKVTTRCEGHVVEMVFLVEEQDKRPRISTRFLEEDIPFSTKIDVYFGNEKAVNICLRNAENALRFYPCNAVINGTSFPSVWQVAASSGAQIFKKGACHGFLTSEAKFPMRDIDILCKYQHIMTTFLRSVIVGGPQMTHDLRDYASKRIPFIPDVSMTVNCNDLRVTIARDSFYMDFKYLEMLDVIRDSLLEHLGRILDTHRDSEQIVLCNQYILREEVKESLLLDFEKSNPRKAKRNENAVIRKLATARVYRLSGRRELFSLADIKGLRSLDLPVYFSPAHSNLRWLGGKFRHDFIILPPVCKMGGGAEDFYGTLFDELFDDVVNLDTITHNPDQITDLVNRGIVDESALSPETKIIGQRSLTREEALFLGQIDELLNYPDIISAITEHLQLYPTRINSAFFDMEGDNGATIATGLFDMEGKALMEQAQSNLEFKGDPIKKTASPQSDQILLGVSRRHPLIQHLIKSHDKYRAYFTLTYLSYELCNAQKLLVPGSTFYNFTKECLAGGMRRALLGHLLPDTTKMEALPGASQS